MNREIESKIRELVERGATFYISHSGGKDSQTMFIEMTKIVPRDQVVVIHAHLPEVEWQGTRKQIADTIGTYRYIEVQATKTFFEMVDHRQMFPGPQYRQCTSDLKRDPINKAIRADLKARGKSLAVICMGLRAEESPGRAKQKDFKKDNRMSKAGREVYVMLPIHDYLVGQVFQTIKDYGQEPHWAYAAGMTRLSCCFCIMASRGDLTTSAKLNPELYKRYVLKERELGFTLQQGKTLEETTGIKLS
jgi:3'-phosphoadenosine 5'-phosphosulfate sulfotransferase (PAPS reductase)/FAD synthetase